MKKIIDFFSPITLVTFIIISTFAMIFVITSLGDYGNVGIFLNNWSFAITAVAMLFGFFALAADIIWSIVFGLYKIILKYKERKTNFIESINPQRITIEELSKFFFFPKFLTRNIMRMGVKEGKFAENEDGTYRLIKEEDRK